MGTDYPRMLFHPTLPPVTVHSRDEEDALGGEWSRIIQPPEAPPSETPAETPPAKPAAKKKR